MTDDNKSNERTRPETEVQATPRESKGEIVPVGEESANEISEGEIAPSPDTTEDGPDPTTERQLEELNASYAALSEDRLAELDAVADETRHSIPDNAEPRVPADAEPSHEQRSAAIDFAAQDSVRRGTTRNVATTASSSMGAPIAELHLAVPGQVIDGRYELVEYIEGGSFGEAWRAWDTRLAYDVAVKLLVPHHDPDVAREDRKRFEREARLTAAFGGKHHIVRVFDYGEDRDRPYLVMNLMHGENLQHLLSGEGRLDPPRAVRILEQIAEALGEAHRNGLVHRDVKPANVFIEAGDEVTLLDFGMLGALDRRRLSERSRRSDLGGGTLEYMAPERFFGDDGKPPEAPSSPPGDIYSLGCLLYQCLTGHRPFLGRTEKDLQRQHRHGPRPRPGDRVEDRREFDGVVARSLAVNPNDRPQNAMDFIHDMTDALEKWKRRSTPDTWVAACLARSPLPPAHERLADHADAPSDDTVAASCEPPADPSRPRPGAPVLIGGASTGILGAGAVLLAGISPIAGGITIAASWAAGACLGWWYSRRGPT